MSLGRTEHRHHTDEQIHDAIRFGLATLEELEVPEHLEELVLGKVIDLRSAKQIELQAAMPLGGAMAIPRGV